MHKKGSGTGMIEMEMKLRWFSKKYINLLVSEEEINKRYKKYGEKFIKNNQIQRNTW